jgi:hypothetical protein
MRNVSTYKNTNEQVTVAVDGHQCYWPYGDLCKKQFVKMSREGFLCPNTYPHTLKCRITASPVVCTQ